MTSNQNPLEPAKIIKNSSPLIGGKFDLVSLSRNSDKVDRIISKQNYIVLLPFDRTDSDKIANVYGIKFQNHATDQSDVTLIIDSIDNEKDSTAFDAIGRSFLEEAGLNIDELGINEDDIFYIGPITLSEPVSAKFKCYAIDLTKISRPDESIEFTTTLAKSPFTRDDSEIVKIGFHQIVNGDFSDAIILAGSFLLVSYFQ